MDIYLTLDEFNKYTKELHSSFVSYYKLFGFLTIESKKREAVIYDCRFFSLFVSHNSGETLKETFIDGFLDGQKHWENHWQIKNELLFSENGKAYINGLIEHYKFRESYAYIGDWKLRRNWQRFAKFLGHPIPINSECVFQMGFFSALVYNTEQLIKKYPMLFKELTPPEIVLPKPESMPQTPFSYSNPQTPTMLYDKLKVVFDEANHPTLKEALNFKPIIGKLFFPHNQNKLSELFLRLYYNGLIIGEKKSITNWICDTFSRKNKDGENESFNYNTVWKTIGQSQNEPGKGKRLFEDLAGYLPKNQRKEEPEAIE